MIEEDQEDLEEKAEHEVETVENKPDQSDASKTPGYQIRSESENKASKLAAEVKSKIEQMKKNADENDSDDDIGIEGDERTIVGSEKQSMVTRDENEEKVVNVTSGKKGSVENGKENDLIGAGNGENPTGAANGDSGQLDSKSDTESVMKKNNEGKGSQKGVKFKDDVKGGKNEGDGDKKGTVKESLENLVETELSWKETNKLDPLNEHRTQCSFDFANSVMFDLDVD